MALDFDLFVTRIAIAVVWALGTTTLGRATRMRPPPMGRQLLSTLTQGVAAVSIFYIVLMRRPGVSRPKALKFYLRALSRRVRLTLDVWGLSLLTAVAKSNVPPWPRCTRARAGSLAAAHITALHVSHTITFLFFLEEAWAATDTGRTSDGIRTTARAKREAANDAKPRTRRRLRELQMAGKALVTLAEVFWWRLLASDGRASFLVVKVVLSVNDVLEDVSAVDPKRALLLTVSMAAAAALSSLLIGRSLNEDQSLVG